MSKKLSKYNKRHLVGFFYSSDITRCTVH